jgi:hypothetical protein
MYDIKTLVDEAIIFDDLCDFAQTYLTIERHRKGMKYAEEWEEYAKNYSSVRCRTIFSSSVGVRPIVYTFPPKPLHMVGYVR